MGPDRTAAMHQSYLTCLRPNQLRAKLLLPLSFLFQLQLLFHSPSSSTLSIWLLHWTLSILQVYICQSNPAGPWLWRPRWAGCRPNISSFGRDVRKVSQGLLAACPWMQRRPAPNCSLRTGAKDIQHLNFLFVYKKYARYTIYYGLKLKQESSFYLVFLNTIKARKTSKSNI